MKRSREQMRTELRALADEVIDELLEWEAATEKPTLTQIEDVVLLLRERFGQRLAEVTVSGQETTQPAEGPVCRECGETMRYKGQKGIAPESRLGELRLERGYYYCARCRSGFFPPGRPASVTGSASE